MNLARDTFRVAVFQRKPRFDDITGTTLRLQEDLQWCEGQRIDLAVFPECFLQGYATDGDTVARRAVSVDGAAFKQFVTAVSRFSADIVVGFIEQRQGGFYNSAVVIRRGEMVGIYAKHHPNAQAFSEGRESPVFRKRNVNYGINICSDANFPASAQQLRKSGAQLICYPLNNMLLPATADRWRVRSMQNLQARARETGCWVVASDVVGTHGDHVCYGCTCIVNPVGDVVAQVEEGTEGVAMFDPLLSCA